jgi:polygalacturonase
MRHAFLLLCTQVILGLSALAGEKQIQDHLTGLPFAMPPMMEPSFPDRRISIAEHGARGDGSVLNTQAFADAIRACADAGGGTVVVPPGTWLTGPIRLESNINLHLERGALIQFSSQIEDFPLIPGFDGKSKKFLISPPIHAYRAKNIAITGPGIIDGAGEAWRYVKKEKLTEREWRERVASGGVLTSDGRQWWPSKEALEGESYLDSLEKEGKAAGAADYARAREFLRPDLVRLVQCEGILVDGSTFRNSPKFHVHLVQSENIIVRNTVIMTPWWAQNGDGLDLAACRTVLVYNTTLDVGDDAICLKPSRIADRQTPGPACENIVIADCVVYRGHGGFVIGSETFGGTRNVSVRNCTFLGTDVGLRFKSLRGRGGVMEKIFIEGVRMRGIENEAILFDMFYGGESPEVEAAGRTQETPAVAVNEQTPVFRDIVIRDVVCIGAGRAVLVRGLPEMPVRNLRMENLRLTARTGVLCIDTDGLLLSRATIQPDRGPVISLRQSRHVRIEQTDVPGSAELFLNVDGDRSQDIRLEGLNLSRAKKGIQTGPDVPPGAVVPGEPQK